MTRHVSAFRVYYEDTDAAGVVYYANYLRFAERARTEALRAAGVPHADLQAEHGLLFVVRRVKMEYLRPASLDCLLRIATESIAIGGASVSLRQIFSDAAGNLAELEVTLVCIHAANLRPARIPQRWRTALAPAGGAAAGEE